MTFNMSVMSTLVPTFGPPRCALVRPVTDAFRDALREVEVDLDPERARAQHAAYVAALEAAGVEVWALPAQEGCPDGCFVEDTAVVTGRHALVTRPGAVSRRGEVPEVEAWLAGRSRVYRMDENDGTLEGGDVLRVGARLYVGRSRRTDEGGVEALSRAAARDGLAVVAVEVRDGLHLKSAVTLLDPDTVVVRPTCLDLTPFVAAGLRCLEVSEPAGGNVLALGGRVLVSMDAPRTAARIQSLGFEVQRVDVSELHKADGALTCLSIRLSAPGQWCV